MRSRDRLLELSLLLLVLALAAYLRLAHLSDNPGWYTDEGTHLDIVRHLIGGRTQYLAVDQSTLLFSRLPLFEALLALWSRVFGLSIDTLRTLTGSLGVMSVALIYLVIRRISHERVLALTTALLLAIYPPAVLYSRFGFSYNLLAPLLILAVAGAGLYMQTKSKRWLALAAISIGLGTITDAWGWVLIVPFAAVVLVREWRDLVWSAPLALLPLVAYGSIMLITAPQAFLFDLCFVLSRLNQLSIAQQVETLWQNIVTLSAQDGWFVWGAIGLFTLRPSHVRWSALIFAAVPFVLLGRTTALFSLSGYYLIPLWPLMALGVSSAIVTVGNGLTRWVNRRAWRAVVIIGLAGSIGLLTVPPLLQQVTTHFRTDIEPFLIGADSAQQATVFVNDRVRANDLVIASPAIAWQIQSNVADFQMPIAYQGRATPHLPADVPLDRWAFDPSYQRARFIIVDNLWRNWAVPNVPGVREMLSAVEAWPQVFRSGEVVVYQNPA